MKIKIPKNQTVDVSENVGLPLIEAGIAQIVETKIKKKDQPIFVSTLVLALIICLANSILFYQLKTGQEEAKNAVLNCWEK